MNARQRSLASAAAVLFLAAGLAACDDDDATGPDSIARGDVVGSYEATTFDLTVGGQTTDQLAAGAQFTINLAGDGTTTGQLFVPGGGEEGGDLDASLEGTWSYDADTREVTFEQDADTFVRDMTFVAVRAGSGIRIAGEETFGDATIDVVLERQ